MTGAAPDGQATTAGDERMPDLAREEHALAQKLAYEKSLARGNGKEPPPFNPEASVGDFWQAAGEVIAQRGTPARILPDGTHFFPIATLRGADGNPIAEATGEVYWSANDGLAYRFEFPHASTPDAAPSTFGMAPRPPDGSINEVSSSASWSGAIAGGGEFLLYSAAGTVTTQHTPVGRQHTSRSTCRGKAALGSITLPLDHPLAFHHDTAHLRREFLPSFMLLSWPDPEEVTFADGTTYHQRLRNRIILQERPRLTVYLGSTTPGTDKGVWLVDEAPSPESERVASKGAEDARAFLSFLVGRNLPFFWRDTFTDCAVRRLYEGALRPHAPILGNEQPLPLYHVREAFQIGAPIGYGLPRLFERFRKVRNDYNLDFVLSPIWTALDGYVDDKLAEASVTLERLSTAHADYLKHSGSAPGKVKFLTKKQGAALREALQEAARQVAADEHIPDEVLTIINRKIGNIHQPPNADKLERIFTDVGLTLRADEEGAIADRNRTLHGRATLGDRENLQAITEELRRFDVLRTLIHKAVLRLLDYKGPYMDYGDHLDGKAYTIRELTPLPTEAAAG